MSTLLMVLDSRFVDDGFYKKSGSPNNKTREKQSNETRNMKQVNFVPENGQRGGIWA